MGCGCGKKRKSRVGKSRSGLVKRPFKAKVARAMFFHGMLGGMQVSGSMSKEVQNVRMQE